MNVRNLFAAGLGIWLTLAPETSQGQDRPPIPKAPSAAAAEPGRLPLSAGQVEPAPVPSYNQRMADAIAERLQLSGRLRGYRVDIRFAGGTAELTGQVADVAQRDEVLGIVQALPGVDRVHDLLDVGGNGVVLTAQGPNAEQGPAPEKLVPFEKQPPAGDDKAPFVDKIQPPLGSGAPQEPLSIMPILPGFNPAMPNLAMQQQQPPMPPYAWPTYAPYNNYSRVAYPTLYPYEAFPFIGPMYPFPKIPLGWRSVSLTWQDGHWWYGREATGHDWWRIRYW